MRSIVHITLSITILLAPITSYARERDCYSGCFKQTLCQIEHDLKKLLACGSATSISQEDIGTSGYVIDKPGIYCLKENIVFCPANPTTFNPVTITDSVGSNGFGAQALAVVSCGVVRDILVLSGGSGYTSPTVAIGGPGNNASASVSVTSGAVTGFTVNQGGTGYKDTVQVAITIKASNVQLVGNGYSLTQAGYADASTIPNYTGTNVPSSQVPFVIGILIPDMNPTGPINEIDLESISIENGIVNGFSMYGVDIQGHTADISVSDVTIKNIGTLASYYLRPFPGYYPNGNPENAGTSPFGIAAFNIGESDVFGLGPVFFTQNSGVAQNRISNVQLNNVSCLNNLCFGLVASNVTDLDIANGHFDGSFNDDPTLWAGGAVFNASNMDYENPSVINLNVLNSTFNDSYTLGDTNVQAGGGASAYSGQCNGCRTVRCENISYQNCSFNNVNQTFAGDYNYPFTTGSINGAVRNITWENCTASDVQAVSYTAQGFHVSGVDFYSENVVSSQNVRFINCVASDIVEHGDLLAYPDPLLSDWGAVGFSIWWAKNVYFENCVASDIICNGPLNFDAFASGFALTAGYPVDQEDFASLNYVFNGCVAQRVITANGGSAVGYFLDGYSPDWLTQTVSLDSCIAEGNTALVPTLPSLGLVQGAGIGFWWNQNYYADVGFPVSYTNCKALNNTGATFVADSVPGTNGNQYSAGFFANSSQPGLPLQNHTYFNCEATSNIDGFVFDNTANIVIRNCRADRNVDPVTGTIGEGFTDLGVNQLDAVSTVSTEFVTPMSNVFGLDPATASSVPGTYVGDALIFTSGENAPFGGTIIDYTGAPLYQVTLQTYVYLSLAPPAAGDGVAIYAVGSTANPLQSQSLFEANKAFANGEGYIHFGENGNYNVIYGSGLEADWVPTMTGNLTFKSAEGGSFFPLTNFVAHNLSITVS